MTIWFGALGVGEELVWVAVAEGVGVGVSVSVAVLVGVSVGMSIPAAACIAGFFSEAACTVFKNKRVKINAIAAPSA